MEMTNKDLELLIYEIRTNRQNDKFDTEEEINAYFKASILIFNNLKDPFWKGIEKGEIKYDDYFSSKMDVNFKNDKTGVINQLFKLWNDKNVTSIEYNLRGLEFILRVANFEIEEKVLKLLVDILNPLKINKAILEN
jgi:hypothetical protein